MFRPRSILWLILIGFAVVLTPLIAAVVTAIVQVDRLAQDSRSAVLEAEIATQQSRSLVEQLPEMQRALGQFHVFDNEHDYYLTYLQRRAVFRNSIENLLELSLTDLGMEQLRALQREEEALFANAATPSGEPDLTDDEIARAWSGLASRARGVLTESSKLIERQANYTTTTADEVQQTLLLQAAAIIPATIFLAGLFVVLITRPMQQVGQAIRRLGGRDFSDPIEVRGPRDLEELGEQLDWLRRRIQELEHQKITFLRHISHELKTPLTTIREGAELLAESLVDIAPEEAEISKIMRGDSLRLQKLIEDLLQFGKTQDLITDLKLVDSLDLKNLIEAVAATHSVASAAKDVCLRQDLARVRVRGDENKLRVVVDNLLANAIKFTPAGGEVSTSLRMRDGSAIIDVRDTGPGIADSEKLTIFEPFQQGRAEYDSSVKGTGLGLAIAREYVEAHDGQIASVASNAGAHFRVFLPVEGPGSGVDE